MKGAIMAISMVTLAETLGRGGAPHYVWQFQLFASSVDLTKYIVHEITWGTPVAYMLYIYICYGVIMNLIV